MLLKHNIAFVLHYMFWRYIIKPRKPLSNHNWHTVLIISNTAWSRYYHAPRDLRFLYTEGHQLIIILNMSLLCILLLIVNWPRNTRLSRYVQTKTKYRVMYRVPRSRSCTTSRSYRTRNIRYLWSVLYVTCQKCPTW